jgi:DNA-directed RNA polymerase subunit RPC12/RpoP
MSEPSPDQFPDAEPAAYTCPQCGEAVAADDEMVTNLLQCPNCGEQFFRPSSDPSGADEPTDEGEANREDELDGQRIARRSSLKRALYRSRSYATVFAVGFGLLLGHTLWLLAAEVRSHGVTRWGVLYLLFAIACGWISRLAFRRTVALNAEARQMTVPEPDEPPDFSTLRDGSQTARRLDDMHK